MKTRYLLFILSIIAVSCNSASGDTAPKAFSKESEKGLIIGTLTFDSDEPKNDIYRFFYYPESTDKKFKKQNDGKIMIKARVDGKRGFNGDFNDKKSYLFIIERDPGKYAFTEYNFLNHIGETGMVNYSSKFAIPFEVKKGEINYIGEITFHSYAEPGSPRITVSDNYSRDIQELKNKYSQIDWDNSHNKTVKSGDTGNGLVEFK
jgi:hypothetical protein